jgi:hypothetical protein
LSEAAISNLPGGISLIRKLTKEGRIAGPGTHEQLIQRSGYYYHLVKGQLALGVQT